MKFLLNYAYEEHFLHFIAFLQQLRALKYNIKTLLTADAVTVKVDPMHCLFSKDLCSSFGNRRALELHWFLCQTLVRRTLRLQSCCSRFAASHNLGLSVYTQYLCFKLFFMVYPHCNAMRLFHREVFEEWEPSNRS